MLLSTGRQHFPSDHAYTRQSEVTRWTLELTYSGTMLRRVGTMARFRVQPNHTLLLVPPATPYALRGRTAGEEIWLIFDVRADLRPCLDWPRGGFGIPELAIPRTPLGRQVLQAFEDTHHHLASRQPRRQMLADNALERLLLLAAELHDAAAAPTDPRILTALDLIQQRFHQPLPVAALARAVRLSPSRFAHLFRQQTGLTPNDYLEQVRLEQAQALLLRTDLQVKAIAARVGFPDSFYFSTRFRARFGQPPTRWRNSPTR